MKTELKLKLLAYTPNPDEVIAKAAKLCYSSVGVEDMSITSEECERFVNMLTSIGHESPIEHVSFTFAVEGISRACSHQIVRHRIASFSQQSQRYVNLKDNFNYITPHAIEDVRYINQLFEKAMDDAFEYYVKIARQLLEYKVYYFLVEDKNIYSEDADIEFLIDVMKSEYKKEFRAFEKQAIEDARYVLPNAAETKMVFTMNARTIHNFLQHRCCDRAQLEIRELAEAMYKEVVKVAPSTFSTAGPSCIKGPCPEGNMSCGKMNEMRVKYNKR